MRVQPIKPKLRLFQRVLTMTPLVPAALAFREAEQPYGESGEATASQVRMAQAAQAGVNERVANLRKDPSVITPVILDNVATYYAENQKEYWNITTDIPNWAPPWGFFFAEWAQPPLWNMGGEIEPTHFPDIQIGLMVVSLDVDRVRKHSGNPTDVAEEFIKGLAGGDSLLLRDTVEDVIGQTRWLLFADAWATDFGKPVCGRPTWQGYCSFVFIDPDGMALKTFHIGPCLEYVMKSNDREAGSLLHVLGLGLSFSHCKNVQIVQSSGPVLPHKRAKRIPSVSFSTVVIDPMMTRRVSSPTASPSTTTPKRALHICRGHFATYTSKAPLFGKYTGTFWVPDHTRGSSKAGEVIKDYHVQAKQEREERNGQG